MSGKSLAEFVQGDIVYHRTLEVFGRFESHDDLDTSSSHVLLYMDGMFEGRRISTSLLDLVNLDISLNDFNNSSKIGADYIKLLTFANFILKYGVNIVRSDVERIILTAIEGIKTKGIFKT